VKYHETPVKQRKYCILRITDLMFQRLEYLMARLDVKVVNIR